MINIAVINGPNINMLGARPEEIYGPSSYEDLVNLCITEAVKLSMVAEVFQTNIEGEIVSLIHKAAKKSQGIIINPAAYCHTSIAIYDALEIIKVPIIEVHLSNIAKREEFRQKSFTARAAKGVISGFGIDSYRLAMIMMRDYVS
jgi:3-dehydroquinate dehydratase-2